MRFREFYGPRVLMEMNVVNGDEIGQQLAAVFDGELARRNINVDKALRDTFLKRLLKACVNDDHGTMVHADVAEVGEGAPAWMQKAKAAGQHIYTLTLKNDFVHRIPHIVDWFAVDPRALNSVRAAPEATYVETLYTAANDFFAARSAQIAKRAPVKVADEPGREVVMTFRALEGGEPRPFLDTSLAPNEHGQVVMFWAKLVGADALDREGSLMDHCVGSYASRVSANEVTIYSLRDAKNMPHATVEISHDYDGQKVLNQVKGKENKTPVGKYAPYIKAFLNDLGVKVSDGGSGDIKGLGLFSRGGRYGSPDELAAAVMATFPNGDTIREMPEDDSLDRRGNPRAKRGATAKDGVYTDARELYYIAKGGGSPFHLTIRGTFDEKTHGLIKGNLIGFTLTRDDGNQYSKWAANLKTYLEDKHIPTETRAMERIGLFYNKKTEQYGPIDEVLERLWSGGGISAYGQDLTTGNQWNRYHNFETIFTEGTLPVFTLESAKQPAQNTEWTPKKVKVERAGSKISSRVPAILLSFLNGVEARFPKRQDEQDILRSYGVVNTKEGYVSGTDTKKAVFSDRSGSIRANGAFLYAVAADGTLLASVRTKNNVIEYHAMTFFSDDGEVEALHLFVGMSKSDNNPYEFKYFSNRKLVDKGFMGRGGKLVPTSDLIDRKLVIGGHRVQIIARESGKVDYIIGDKETEDGYEARAKQHRRDLDMWRRYGDDEDGPEHPGELESAPPSAMIVTLDEHDRLEHVRNMDNGLRHLLPALLKQIKAKVKVSEILHLGMKLQGDKLVALTDKDADLKAFVAGKMNLGKDLIWKGRSSRSKRWAPSLAGDIEFMGGDREEQYSYGTTVARVETHEEHRYNRGQHNSDDKDEYYADPKIEMKRSLPDGCSRDEVFKAVTKLMKFYHEKIVPYEDTSYTTV